MAPGHSAGMLLVVVAAVLIPATIAAQLPAVGRPAPGFALPTLRGDTVRLAQYRGHPVILKFWASWCPTCRTEMPELLAARAAHRDAGLEVLAIDGDESPARMRSYLRKLAIDESLPVLVDDHRRAQVAFRIPILPTTVFIDTAGVVQVIHAGAMRPEQLAASLRIILPPTKQE